MHPLYRIHILFLRLTPPPPDADGRLFATEQQDDVSALLSKGKLIFIHPTVSVSPFLDYNLRGIVHDTEIGYI